MSIKYIVNVTILNLLFAPANCSSRPAFRCLARHRDTHRPQSWRPAWLLAPVGELGSTSGCAAWVCFRGRSRRDQDTRAGWQAREARARLPWLRRAAGAPAAGIPSLRPTRVGAASPAQQRRPAQGHEVDLTTAARAHRGEEHLVIALAQELESLRPLVHEYAIQVAGFH